MTGDRVRILFGSGQGLSVTLALVALGTYLLWNHTGHLVLALPYLFLLACPLMHLSRRRHGHHGHGGDKEMQR